MEEENLFNNKITSDQKFIEMLIEGLKEELQTFSPQETKLSVSSSTSVDSHSPEKMEEENWNNDVPSHILSIFQESTIKQTLSAKISQKAVSWILTIAWSKNFSFQSSWTALLLFYGCKAQRVILKQELESLLLTCLRMATKIHESVPLKTSELLLCCSQPVSRQNLVHLEYEILQIFDYNILLPHTLDLVAANQSFDEQTILKILFLSELYLTKDPSLFFDCQKMKKIIKIVTQYEDHPQQLQQIKEMIVHPFNKIVLNKFSSKFDLDLFLINFQ